MQVTSGILRVKKHIAQIILKLPQTINFSEGKTMAKHGDGLACEIVRAVNQGKLKEPLTTQKVRNFAKSKGWDVKDSQVRSCLSNGASDNYSPTNKKYFKRIARGQYEVK